MSCSRMNRRKLVARAMKVVVVVMVVGIIMDIPFVRNTLTAGHIPSLWKDIPAYQLLKFYLTGLPHVVFLWDSTLGVCSDPGVLAKQRTAQHDPLHQLLTSEPFHSVQARPSDQAAITRAQNWLDQSEERRQRYGRFAPRMTAKEKAQMLLTWRVLHAALMRYNVSHYIRAGTQIGALRHRGLIPWDDDMDVGVDANDVERVRHALSCVPGYTLRVIRGMAWKFFADDANVVQSGRPPAKILYPKDLAREKKQEWHSDFDVVFRWPGIDIFLMVSDGAYTWCNRLLYLTNCVYRLEDIYPLILLPFEGMMVPAPRRSLSITKTIITDDNLCQSSAFNHETKIHVKNVSTVPCEELASMYTMYPV